MQDFAGLHHEVVVAASLLSHSWLETAWTLPHQAFANLLQSANAIGPTVYPGLGVDDVPGSQNELTAADEADLAGPRAADPRTTQRRHPNRVISQHRHPELLANHLWAFAAL